MGKYRSGGWEGIDIEIAKKKGKGRERGREGKNNKRKDITKTRGERVGEEKVATRKRGGGGRSQKGGGKRKSRLGRC